MGKKKSQNKSSLEDEAKENNDNKTDSVDTENSSNFVDSNKEIVDNKVAEDVLELSAANGGKSTKTHKQLYEEMKKNKKEIKKGGKDKKTGEKESTKDIDIRDESKKSGEPLSIRDDTNSASIIDDNDENEEADSLEDEPQYPINVVYCPFCTFPAEMCEYSGMFEKCKTWLMEQLTKEEDKIKLKMTTEKGRKRKILTEKSKLQEILKKMEKDKVEPAVSIECHNRKRSKFITSITGLDIFGVNLKEALTDFKKSFSTGASISQEPDELDSIEIQGNFIDKLLEVLPNKYNVPRECIKIIEKKKPAKTEDENKDEEEDGDDNEGDDKFSASRKSDKVNQKGKFSKKKR